MSVLVPTIAAPLQAKPLPPDRCTIASSEAQLGFSFRVGASIMIFPVATTVTVTGPVGDWDLDVSGIPGGVAAAHTPWFHGSSTLVLSVAKDVPALYIEPPTPVPENGLVVNYDMKITATGPNDVSCSTTITFTLSYLYYKPPQ